MTFTQIPQQNAPLGGELRYAVRHEQPTTIDIRILDTPTGMVLGTKRFVDVTEVSFDVAPYVRRGVQTGPAYGGTGFRVTDERMITVTVEATAQLAVGTTTVRSASRTFLALGLLPAAPALITTMPRERIIGPDECDDLVFYTAEALQITLTTMAGDTATAQTYRASEGGMKLFRLDMRDFAGAETLTVDAGACGQVTYTVDALGRRAGRLAWCCQTGSVEYYTFPLKRATRHDCGKTSAYGPSGYVTAATRNQVHTLFESAYETEPVLTALMELATASRVWLAEGDSYTQVDVVSIAPQEINPGSVGSVEIEIRSIRKTPSPWN